MKKQLKMLQVAAVEFTIKKYISPLIIECQRQGYRVDVACFRIGDDGTAIGHHTHHIPFSRGANIFKHLVSLVMLVRLIKKEKYDIIHAHTPVAGLVARLAGKIARVPRVVYTAHGFYFHEGMKQWKYRLVYWLEKIWCRAFTDFMFLQSKEDYELAIKNKFLEKNQVLHIGNGVSPVIYDPDQYNRFDLRNAMGIEPHEIVLIFVGRIVYEKGIRELVEAFNMVMQKGLPVRLLIVGGKVEGDRGSADIEQLCQGLSDAFRERIHCLGLRDDIPQLLFLSDVFLLPSYREGLPRSIIEAMAMCKPVIATNIRGCREEVVDGFNGYLCSPKDTLDLFDKITNLITNKEDMILFGQRSRELFLDFYDENVVVDKQIKVFETFKGG